MSKDQSESKRFRLQPIDSGTCSKRHYTVIDYKGNPVSGEITEIYLDRLRELSRECGNPLERLDLWDLKLNCNNCKKSIRERFGSTTSGNLLCWDCAMARSVQKDNRGVSHTTDPTKAVLSNSALHHKNLCNYIINVATGCSHGCKFCYVPSTPNIKTRGDMLEENASVQDGQKEWGSYLLYRDDLPERLGRKLDRKQKWDNEKGGRGVVMISSGTDCYQDRRAAQITRGCVIELVNHQRPVRILTRSPAVVRDLDVFKAANGLVTVGSSIPCLDDEMVRSIEPGAPAASTRLNALEEISNAGVPVYVSMSPTYPTQNRDDLRELLKTFKKRLDPDVVFHEPINPRGANFEMTVQAARDAGQEELANELAKIRKRKEWVDYSIRQLEAVEELGEELDVPVHLWPDKQLINHLNGEKQKRMKAKLETTKSPEEYPRAETSA